MNEPRVLLLDEPLGALDLKLREAMQDELKALQQRLGITFVFVTHDQHEALSMADQLAVFNQGRIAQIGTPEDIYARPATRFVADFVGSSNVLPPEVTRAFGGPMAWASLRPEAIRLAGIEGAGLVGEVLALRYLGGATRVTLRLVERATGALPQAPGYLRTDERAEVSVLVSSGQALPGMGDVVGLAFDPTSLHVMEGA